ncbi:MAG: Gfo/Idh/MocA family oxidoreductase, partial [Woeseiaceae bacterium]|nr:Gfo/Idh/MocA family oxidoreductase [Woeseiaceae bacterium]
DGIDAVYVATPTGVREMIAVAAAAAGRHVLAEKPFASLPSLQRIVDACRRHDVGFMDANHFGHHPRTAAIRAAMDEHIGRPNALESAFQFALDDRDNIRFDSALEPMGAVGDVGWYCMRAIAEYLPRDLGIDRVATVLRRDPATGAAVQGAGVLQFADGTTSSWNASYESGAVFTDLRITGEKGVITLDDFPANNADGSADYRLHRGGFGTTTAETLRIESPYTSRQLMFEDFAAMAGDAELRERSIADSLRTQALLDRIWEAGLEQEARASRTANR